MLRRFILLVFVAGLSGTAGLWVGLLYAPAPGEETRQKLADVFIENDDTFDDLFARSRQALGDAIDAVSRTLKAEGERELDE
jgi:gas vesicle protein